MPLDLSKTDAAEQLRYDFDLKGRTIFQLDDTIVPVVVVTPGEVEGSFVPRQGEWVTGFAAVGNLVGNTPKVGFSPPPGKMAVLRTVGFTMAAGQDRLSVFKILNNGLFVAPTAPDPTQSAFCERHALSDAAGLFTFTGLGAALVGVAPFEFQSVATNRGFYGTVPPFVFAEDEILLFENPITNGILQLAIAAQLYDIRGTRRS